jgi:hypothetical protein
MRTSKLNKKSITKTARSLLHYQKITTKILMGQRLMLEPNSDSDYSCIREWIPKFGLLINSSKILDIVCRPGSIFLHTYNRNSS